MMYSDQTIEQIIRSIRNRTNAAFEEWAQYNADPEAFIKIVYWLGEETQEERVGNLRWARGVGLIVPHKYLRTLGGDLRFFQTGPAELHRLRNEYHELTGLAFIHDFDTDESWIYHAWPHLTLQDIAEQKRYPLEQSTHSHPELQRFIIPDKN